MKKFIFIILFFQVMNFVQADIQKTIALKSIFYKSENNFIEKYITTKKENLIKVEKLFTSILNLSSIFF